MAHAPRPDERRAAWVAFAAASIANGRNVHASPQDHAVFADRMLDRYDSLFGKASEDATAVTKDALVESLEAILPSAETHDFDCGLCEPFSTEVQTARDLVKSFRGEA